MNLIMNLKENQRIGISADQIGCLLDFLEKNPKLILIGQNTRTIEGRAQARKLWEECAKLLNEKNGTKKTGFGWRSYYNEYKFKTIKKIRRSKAAFINEGGELKSVFLTDNQNRLYNLLLQYNTQDPNIIDEGKSEDYVFGDKVDASDPLFNMEVPDSEDDDDDTRNIGDKSKSDEQDTPSTSTHLDETWSKLCKTLVPAKYKKEQKNSNGNIHFTNSTESIQFQYINENDQHKENDSDGEVEYLDEMEINVEKPERELRENVTTSLIQFPGRKRKFVNKKNIKEDDSLRQMLNTVYMSMVKMPKLSQIKLKRKIFNLVMEEEESLLQ